MNPLTARMNALTTRAADAASALGRMANDAANRFRDDPRNLRLSVADDPDWQTLHEAARMLEFQDAIISELAQLAGGYSEREAIEQARLNVMRRAQVTATA